MKYLDDGGLLYVVQKIKTWLLGKVDKIEGKGLSTNDYDNTEKGNNTSNTSARHTHTNKTTLDSITAAYTTEEKNKLAGLENYNLPTASATVKGGIKVGAGLSITDEVLSASGGGVADSVEWANVQNKPSFKTVATSGSYNDLDNKPTIPTNTNQLTNGAGYQNASQVSTAIASAIEDIQGISYSIVAELPATGEAGIIYLISNSGSNPNIYDEYIWITDKFEKIGTTAVDLSGYIQETDLVAITNGEIDTIVA